MYKKFQERKVGFTGSLGQHFAWHADGFCGNQYLKCFLWVKQETSRLIGWWFLKDELL